MNRIIFALFFLLGTPLLLISCAGRSERALGPSPTPIAESWASDSNIRPIFSLSETVFDFGTVKQSAGPIEHVFSLRYNGEKPIKITGIPTSCACTTAKIDKTILNKGESANVTVTFDPNLHEEPSGKFFKTISVLTEPSLETPPELKIWVQIDLDLWKGAYKLKEPHKD